MKEKDIILASIASSIACNCIPCYEHYWLKAVKAGISKDDIFEAVSIGEKVKNGAAVAVQNKVEQIYRGEIPEEKLGIGAPCGCGCD